MQEATTYIQNSNHPRILVELRDILKRYSTLNEEFKWNMPVYTINDKDICYIKDTKKGVNVGFTKAQQLNDVARLLEGTGKDMRHIKLLA